MKDKGTARVSIANNLVLIGIGFSVLFWIIEAVIHVFVFHEGNLIEQIFTRDPNELWMRFLVTGIFVVFGVYAQLIINKRKKAEDALKESEKRYRILVETSSECICNLDLEGNFLYMSPAGLQSHEMSEDEVKGMHCTKLAKPEYSDLLNETLEKAKRGERVVFQYESETPSGDRWFESTLTPIKDDSGKVISLIRLSRDITERKRAQDELNKRLKELERWHDVTVDREVKMVELKDRIEELEEEIERSKGK